MNTKNPFNRKEKEHPDLHKNRKKTRINMLFEIFKKRKMKNSFPKHKCG